MIITGQASITRREGGAQGDLVLLAEPGDGQSFGERALLKSEPRFATVRAETPLQTVMITRTTFEKELGPLEQLLEDVY